jgi:general secretion pathway protein A
MKDFYGLAEPPFALTPDPRFIVWSPTHRATFQHLLHAYQSHQPMSVITGDRGTGKTTLLQALRADLQAQAPQTPLALLSLAGTEAQALYMRMAAAFGLASSGRDRQDALSTLNAFFLHQLQTETRIVLLLDAAHEVPESLLEEIGFLARIGTAQHKLFHIVLAGPPSLQDTLTAPRFAPLKARVRVVGHLAPLTPRETHVYITRRLAVAGRQEHEPPLFHPDAIAEIYHYSHGLPRAINLLCSHALLSGFRWQRACIDAELMRHVVTHLRFPGAQAGQSNDPTAKRRGPQPEGEAKPRPSDAEGGDASHAKPRQRAARSRTVRLPVALLSLGITLLVAAGTFVTPRGLGPARGAWLRARVPPTWDTRRPTARESVPTSVQGPEDQMDPAAVAGQWTPAAPVTATAMARGELLLPGLQQPAGPFQDERPSDPTRAPRLDVAAPLPTAFPSGSGAVTPPQTRQPPSPEMAGGVPPPDRETDHTAGSAVPPPLTPSPPPEQFIRTYYQAINQRQYTQTWAMLSTAFKQTRLCCDPEGNYQFTRYTAWWNTMEKVEILGAKTLERDTHSVYVLSTVRYYQKNGRVIDETHRFSLIEDRANQSWLIEAQTRGTRAQKG